MAHITIIATLKIPQRRITNVISLFLLYMPRLKIANSLPIVICIYNFLQSLIGIYCYLFEIGKIKQMYGHVVVI